MDLRELVEMWFAIWDAGDYQSLPIAEDFRHTSPYGTIEGKQAYLDLAAANEDKFIDNEFEIHDAIYLEDRACVRYTMRSLTEDHTLEVSEWYYPTDGLIGEIVAYYNIEGVLSDARKLKDDDNLS